MCFKRYFSLCNMGVLLLFVMMGGGGGAGGGVAGKKAKNHGPAEETVKTSPPAPAGIIYEPLVARQANVAFLANEAPFPLPALDLESQIELIAKNSHEREKSKADSLAAVVNI